MTLSNAAPKPRNLVLVGFMGAGKTTVGRLLAEKLGMVFVDTDNSIEQHTGTDIPTLFATKGEAYFRSQEAQVIQQLAQQSGQVIATGGGALQNPQTLAALLEHNYVVWLHTSIECAVQRATAQGNRPLLSGTEALAKARTLYATRLPLYAQAHLTVGADNTPETVCEAIAAAWRLALTGGLPVQHIPVQLGERSYNVVVGTGLLDILPQLLPFSPRRVLVVSDTHVAQLYSQRVLDALSKAGWEPQLYIFPAGEESKSLQTLQELYTACASASLERSSPVLALGGGVVGDAAGFAAATYLRGLPFIQVPTTLLAQVDSSVGGKVAINLKEGKNLAGAFHQPSAVVADVSLLTSLPKRELLSGLAEVIKHGMIADAELFAFIETHIDDILAYHPTALAHLVTRSCEIKRSVVEADEKESSLREVLNFGHTVGHAVEVVSGYGTYAHGEAVAIGMVSAARLSEKLGFPTCDLTRLVRLLLRAGLPVNAPSLDVQALIAVMRHDKKVRNGEIRFVLSPALGQVQPGMAIDSAVVEQTLAWQNALPNCL